jgi:hypothetical protein
VKAYEHRCPETLFTETSQILRNKQTQKSVSFKRAKTWNIRKFYHWISPQFTILDPQTESPRRNSPNNNVSMNPKKEKSVIEIGKKRRESKAGTFLYNKTTKSPSVNSVTPKSQKGNSISVKEIHFGSLYLLLKSKPDQD